MRFRSVRISMLASLILLASIWSGFAIAVAQSDATPAASPVASPVAVPASASPVALDSWPQWIQLGPNDSILARAVRMNTCPEITIDGQSQQMEVRAEATANHPNVVCQSTVPAGSTSVAIEGRSMPLPDPDPQRIAVLGDTGCRLEAPDSFQACNDPSAWPFEQIATSVDDWDPDLIIHVGDYIYREAPCPDSNSGCAGSPYGDTWDTWNADFFTPAAPVLDAAPWILVRGNHEDCSREGEGWFRYLDPMPVPAECQPYTEPWALSIGGVRAVVLDVASAQDTKASDDVTDAYKPIFEQALALAGDGPSWLLTHRPVSSIGADSDGQPTEWSTATYNATGFAEQSSVFDLIIAGHVHMSQLLWFTEESERTPNLIAGDGGTELDDMATGMFTGSDLSDPELVQGWRWQDFGFMTIQPIDTGFVTYVRLLDGTTPATCLSAGHELSCIQK